MKLLKFLLVMVIGCFLAVGAAHAQDAGDDGADSSGGQQSLNPVPGNPGSWSANAPSPSQGNNAGEPGQLDADPNQQGQSTDPGGSAHYHPLAPPISGTGVGSSKPNTPSSILPPQVTTSAPPPKYEPPWMNQPSSPSPAQQAGEQAEGFRQLYERTVFPEINKWVPRMLEDVKRRYSEAPVTNGLKVPPMESPASILARIYSWGFPREFQVKYAKGFSARNSDIMSRYSAQESQVLNSKAQAELDVVKKSMQQIREATRDASTATTEILSAEVPAVPELKIPAPPKFSPDVDSIYRETKRQLDGFTPVTGPEVTLKDLANLSLYDFQQHWESGDQQEARQYLDAAKKIANFLVGIDPISGFVRSAYEASSGKNMITGESLTSFERSLAVVNLSLLGFSSEAVKGLSLVEKLGISTKAAQALVAKMVELRENVTSLIPSIGNFYHATVGRFSAADESALMADIERGLTKVPEGEQVVGFEGYDSMTSDYVRQTGTEPPYWYGTYGLRVELAENPKMVRFSFNSTNGVIGESGPIGKFMVRESDTFAADGARLTPEQLQNKFALPKQPRFVSDVKIPAGGELVKSRAAPNFGMKGGGIQYGLDKDAIKHEYFQNTRPISGWYNGK